MSDYKSELPYIQRFFKHLKTITLHKYYVAYYCFKVGLYKQGITHDLSKYSPTEFFSSVKYFQGNRSPIDMQKEVEGQSECWFHHFGHNNHHWEHYIDLDRVNKIIRPYVMPNKYVLESICDRMAACRVYQGENAKDDSAYNYFMNGKDRIFMHPDNSKQFEYYLHLIATQGFDASIKELKQLKTK